MTLKKYIFIHNYSLIQIFKKRCWKEKVLHWYFSLKIRYKKNFFSSLFLIQKLQVWNLDYLCFAEFSPKSLEKWFFSFFLLENPAIFSKKKDFTQKEFFQELYLRTHDWSFHHAKSSNEEKTSHTFLRTIHPGNRARFQTL